jgi:hypothetical protein
MQELHDYDMWCSIRRGRRASASTTARGQQNSSRDRGVEQRRNIRTQCAHPD